MRIVNILSILFLAGIALPVCSDGIDSQFLCDYLGQKTPDEIPVKFGPGVVSTNDLEHSSPQFSLDGTEMFWISIAFPLESNTKTLWFMKRENGAWSDKQPAPFNSEYNEDSPVFSPDGKRLYFNSSRPRPEGMDGKYWYVERAENGWSEPVYDTRLNAGGSRRGLSFARNGTIYFSGKNPGTANGFGICFSKLVDNEYTQPEPLDVHINKPGYLCWTPFIAPDKSYLIYSMSVGELKQARDYGNLYISFHNKDGSWSEPIELGRKINTPAQERFPYVTPDGKYLFFTRWTQEGNQDVFWVKSTAILDLQRKFERKAK